MNLNHHQIASFVFLGVVALGLLIAAVIRLKSAKRYNLVERFLYLPVYSLARTLWRVELHWDPQWESEASQFTSRKIEPRALLRDRMEKGAVLVANHRASIDPFFIQLAAGCRVHWMVAGEYFSHPLFGALLRSFQAIPTKRGGADNAATKQAIRLASSGKFVGMFPEGRINRTSAPLLSVRPGAALVAAKSKTPIIPIWIEGAPSGPAIYSPLFKSAHVRVHIGYPVMPPQSLLETKNDELRPERGTERDTERGAEIGETSEANRTRDPKDKAAYLAWIEQAMGDSLKLGKCSTQGIEHAGRSWIQS